MSYNSLPSDTPDLSLRSVAFARLSEGRVVARGNFETVGYFRSGGRLTASRGAAVLEPEPGTGLASFGNIRVSAPVASGETTSQRGTASGGVRFDAARGDTAVTESVEFDGATNSIRGVKPVDMRGPGYRVHGNGLLARTDSGSIDLTGGVTGSMEMEARK
jgi:hypothetical protein